MGQTSENLEAFYDSGIEGRGFGLRYHLGKDVRVSPLLTLAQVRELRRTTVMRFDLLREALDRTAWGPWLQALPRRPGGPDLTTLAIQALRAWQDAVGGL